MLSRIAREMAAQINSHDWSDAPYRLDRAGHQRHLDSKSKSSTKQPLDPTETDYVRTNVMWNVAQVLIHQDPNFDVYEFAAACGVPRSITHRTNGTRSDAIKYGLRWKDAECTVPESPGAPLWLVNMWCEVPDAAVFKRLLLKVDGLDPSINPQVESLGNLQKVTVALRESDSDRAGLRAVEIVSSASTAVEGGKPAELADTALL